MEFIAQIIATISQGSVLEIAREVFAAYLMILGGLKVIARLTSWKGDDAAVELLGKPVDFLKTILGPKDPK